MKLCYQVATPDVAIGRIRPAARVYASHTPRAKTKSRRVSAKPIAARGQAYRRKATACPSNIQTNHYSAIVMRA